MSTEKEEKKEIRTDLLIFIKYLKSQNPNVLNKLSKTGKEKLKLEMKDIEKKERKKSIKQLIYNHFNYNIKDFRDILDDFGYTDKLKYIQGPISLTGLYSKKYDKIIYIFGDQHDVKDIKEYMEYHKEENSMFIQDFLKYCAEYTDRFIDIFLETDPISLSFKNSFIHEVIDTFKNCIPKPDKLTSNLSGCQFNTVRIHYTDIRRLYKEDREENKESFLRLFTAFDLSEDDLMIYGLNIEFLKIFKDGMDKLRDNFGNYFKDNKTLLSKFFEEYKKYKLERQISSVKDKFVKDKLLEWFNNKIDEFKLNDVYLLLSNYKLLEKDINEIINYKLSYGSDQWKRFREFYEKYKLKLLFLNGLFMDLFLLSRIFREFKFKKDVYSKEPRNIFIYVGQAHADNYIDFLSNVLNFNITFQLKSSKKKLNVGTDKVSDFGGITFDMDRITHIGEYERYKYGE